MTTPKKIEANRRNSRKSTGPRTTRGKQVSSLNALRLGVFANTRILPGESETAYGRVRRAFLEECRPVGPIQKILTDQMIGAFWRLARIERAERTYFMEIRAAHISRFLRSLEPRDIDALRRRYSGANSSERLPGNENDRDSEEVPIAGANHADADTSNANWHSATKKFTRFPNWDTALLEALVPAKEARPKTSLDKQRRAALRELLRAVEAITCVQRTSSSSARMSPDRETGPTARTVNT